MKRLCGAAFILCCLLVCACSPAAVPGDVTLDFVQDSSYAAPAASQVPQAVPTAVPAATPVSRAVETPQSSLQGQETNAGAEQATPGPTPVHEVSARGSGAAAPAQEGPAPVATDVAGADAAAAAGAQAGVASSGAPPLRSEAMEYVLKALALEGVNMGTADFHIRITCNTGELFSCVAEVQKKPGGNSYTLYPITVDMRNGNEIALSDFFDASDLGWKSLLPDIVTDIAKQQGMTLLCEVPPVSGDQPFYIEGEAIVLVYRPYEISTYEAGEPCFTLPMREISQYTTGAYGIGG